MLSKNEIKQIVEIREFESQLNIFFGKGYVNGTTHTSVGQEDIAIIMSKLIDKKNDMVFSNHRCHAHYLSLSQDYEGLLYEILGKEGGVCGGLGGSQHLCNGYFFSSGILGSGFPIAVGASLAKKLNKSKGKVFIYLGEGTFGQGIVYESFNFASLWSLPIIFIIEDNGISQSTLSNETISGRIEDRAKAFNIDYYFFPNSSIKERCEGVIELFRKGIPHPVVLHFKTNRLNAHSKGDDTREKKYIDELKNSDPIRNYIHKELSKDEIDSIKNNIKSIFNNALNKKDEKQIFYLNE